MATVEYEGILTYRDADENLNRLYPVIKTDPTLSLSDKAADAYTVGEKLAALYTANATGTITYVIPNWEQGNLNSSGAETTSSNLYRTVGYQSVISGATYTVELTGGNGLNTRAYDENKTFLRSYNISATSGDTSGTITFGTDVAYFRSVLVAYNNDVTTYPVSPDNVTFYITNAVLAALDTAVNELQSNIDDIADEILVTNQTTVKSGNIGEFLPNKLLSDAPANSGLLIGTTAVPLLGDAPNTETDVIWLLTYGNSGNQSQIAICRKDTYGTGLFYRTVYNYGTTNYSVSPWEAPGASWRTVDWCFFGDSLTYRASVGYGYPDVLGIESDYVNHGTQQATMAQSTTTIQTQIDTQIAEETEFGGIILGGGYNDWYGSTLGEIPTSLPDSVGDIDRTTTCGGLTYCLYQLLNRYSSTKIYYITPHKINSASYSGNGSRTTTLENIVDAMIAICNLFGVEVIDCFHNSGLNTYYSAAKSVTQDSDGIHPTRDGYRRFYAPVVIRHIQGMQNLIRE